MVARRLARLIVDPAITLAAVDSVSTYRLRMMVLLISVPLVFGPSPEWAIAWASLVAALEIEGHFVTKRRLADGGLSRTQKWAYLSRGVLVITAWSGGPAIMMLAPGGRFLIPALIWVAGLVLASVTVAFRGALSTAVMLTPSLLLFAGAPFIAAGRFGANVAVELAVSLVVYTLFAINTAKRNHTRERSLRRTRIKLIHEAEEVRRLAFHDQLTGLANRRQLMDQITRVTAHAARNGEDVALLLIDLDRFKEVNDVYGHACGDDLLREVAQRLRRASRGGDVCARLGGDEFVVLAPGCGAQDAASLAARILKSFGEPMMLAETVHQAGGSIGISVCKGEAACGSEMLREADLALYKVKSTGRNAYCFFETELDRAVEDRRGLEADLRSAIAAGDIAVVYRPQFAGAEMVGVEATARWTHPTRGVVDPGLFIPLAETSGLIVALTQHVVRRAFIDSARWPHLQVAIALSPIPLKTPGFLDHLHAIFKSSGARADRIEFELPGTVLLSDDPQTQQTLAALRTSGFHIALKGFGRAYTGVGKLRNLPIDAVKIDRVIVSSLPGDEIAESILQAATRLAATLGLRVVAEGVETAAQQAAIARAGCGGAQGDLLGRPVTAGAIDAAVVASADAERRVFQTARSTRSKRRTGKA